jgi:hypothetical protein
MKNKAYIFIFDRESFTVEELDKFHNDLTTAQGIVSWWHYLSSAYILIVQENIKATDINNFLLKVIPKKHIFVSELNLINHNGFLPPNAWDWIKKQLTSI